MFYLFNSKSGEKMESPILWPVDSPIRKQKTCPGFCITMVAFTIGLTVGVLIPVLYFCREETRIPTTQSRQNSSKTAEKLIGSVFLNNSHSIVKNTPVYPTVSFVETDGLIDEGIFWGKQVEGALPKGYGDEDNHRWSSYIKNAVGVRLEQGCGRMQNRLVTFQDGTRGCVRYRQNLDQIQGELFSFYLAQLLELPNLAPSAVSLVDLKTPNWQNLLSEISSAQWVKNRPIVITKFISNLDTAHIPKSFRPPETRLSHQELTKNNTSSLKEYSELAQWSDLVIFDYLTANLDRVVNNLYNKQWNMNIMEAPAHNLARRTEDDLLVFLDNESGLLHGYRLLQKYEPYHALLLDNLCIFRRKTVSAIERLRKDKNIGKLLGDMFEKNTSLKIRDYLPPLPSKSVKILNERLEKVHNQIIKCRRETTNKKL